VILALSWIYELTAGKKSMPKHPEQQILEHYKSDAALNSLDLQPMPKISIKPATTERQNIVASPVSDRRPEPQPEHIAPPLMQAQTAEKTPAKNRPWRQNCQ